MVMTKMKMPPRTMTNSNCTPPSGLRSYGKVVYVFGTLPIIGFVVFACKILALFPLVGSCLLMFVFVFILPYLCICVSMLLPTRSLHFFLLDPRFVWYFCFCCWLFLYLGCCFFCVFVYLIYFSVITDQVSFQYLCIWFIYFSLIRSHSNRGCTIRTGPSSSPTKM